MSKYKPTMSSTNNPYIDYLLYYTKILAFGSVIKDEDIAQKYETKESILNGDALISCIEGTAIFELFKFDDKLLMSAGITDKNYIQKCIEDSSAIPDNHAMIHLSKIIDEDNLTITGGTYKGQSYNIGDYITIDDVSVKGITFKNYKVTLLDDDRVVAIYALRDELTEKASKKYIENYHEINNYYRKLAGLPNIGDPGIPIIDYEYVDIAANTIKQFINVNHVTYVHELSPEQISYLNEKGVLDIMRADYPDADYLDYINNKIVDYDDTNEKSVKTYMARKIYKLRKAYNFQLVYVPETSDDGVVEEKFKETYEKNRIYVIHSYYSDAFKIESQYYTSFMAMMIMIMTMTDMLSEVHEHIIKRDFLDKRCIQYIFEQYGMPYFTSIPIKYQYRMCKNINQLIRYKSCTTGMLNIIDLFGAENIEIFKYFILRDRNVDQWGNLIYNEIVTKNSNTNDVLKEEDTSITMVNGKAIIPYPSAFIKSSKNPNPPEYLASGNKMIVYDDNNKITNYSLSSDKKTINIYNYNNRKLNFKFIYNTETIKPYIDKDRSVKISYETGIAENKNLKLKNLPNSTFLVDGNDLAIIVDGKVLINTYEKTYFTIDTSSNILKLTETPKDNNITVIYAYNKNLITKLSVIEKYFEYDEDDENNTIDRNRIFINEPFYEYIKRGNSFIALLQPNENNPQDVKILSNPKDYTLEKTEGGNYNLVLKKQAQNGNIFTFIFIYSKNASYYPIDINKTVENFKGETPFQTEFKLHPPFKKYFEKGYKAYPRLRNNEAMLNTELYDIYNNTLNIRNQALGLQVGQDLEVTYVYGPDVDNINVTKQIIEVIENDQSIFENIEFPIKDFFENNNIIIDVIGNYLNPSDYLIDENTKTLTIVNPDKLPKKGQYVQITFYTAGTPDESIQLDHLQFVASSDKQFKFNMSYPFSPYTETGHSALVFYTNTDETKLVTTFTLDDEALYIPLEKIKKGDIIDVFPIYNSYYVKEASSYITSEIQDVNVLTNIEEIKNDLGIKIPYPFRNYSENGWIVYLTNENNVLIDSSSYNLLDGYLTFVNPEDLEKYKIIHFNFYYYDNERYVYTQIEEDYDKDFTLKFIGIPIENPYFNKGIINLTNELSYESVTREDKYWDGVSYEDNLDAIHKRVKHEILEKRFNYERTKYYGLNYVYDIANMTFQIAYFYNIFYDSVFKENKLTLRVPSITSYKKFNLANLFVYMTALAYIYSGASDSIIDTSSKILYIKGFNFKADIEKLKEWIWSKKRDPDNFDTLYYYKNRPASLSESITLPTNRTKEIWKFNTLKNSEFKTMNELVDMISTHNDKKLISNADIYNFIVKNIYESQDYDIFIIWKKLFDSLMTYRESFEFYKITDYEGETRIAKTLTEFLQYKDRELYNDLQDIRYINDTDQRNEKIINRITDVVYLLENYIDMKTFTNIFDMFPGVSGDFFLDILFTIINFFKSYKIVLRSKGDYIIFSAKDPYLNTLRLIDEKDNATEKDVYDYYCMHIKAFNSVSIKKEEKVGIKEEHLEPAYWISDISNSRDDIKKAQLANKLPITNKSLLILDKTNHQTILAMSDNTINNYECILKSSSSKQIKQEVEYGNGFYLYLKADPGYNAGVLNKRFVRMENAEELITATDATIITKLLIINVSKHIHIIIYELINNKWKLISNDNKSFVVNYGAKLKIEYTIDEGFDFTGRHLYINDSKYTDGSILTIVKNTKITSAAEPVPVKLTVNIESPDDMSLVCTFGDERFTVGMNQSITKKVNYGTRYSILIRTNSDYTQGSLIGYNNKEIPKYGTFTYSLPRNNNTIYITSTQPIKKQFKVSIIQSDNQTIYVTYKGIDYNKDFNAEIHSKIYAYVVASTGYTAGRPSFTETIVNENVFVSATPAVPTIYTVSITTPKIAKAIFTYGDAESIAIPENTNKLISNVKYKDSYELTTSIPDNYDKNKYVLGNITPKAKGLIDSSISDNLNRIVFTIEPTKIKKFNVLMINSDKEHQQISFVYNNKTYTDDNNTITVDYDSVIKPVLTIKDKYKTDYNIGELSITPSTLIRDTTYINANPASIKRAHIILTKYPTQKLIATDQNGSQYTDDFDIDYHSSLTITAVSTNDLYDAGSPSVSQIKDVLGNTTITASNPIRKTCKVTIGNTNYQTIEFHVNNKVYGANSAFTVPKGSEYKVVFIPDEGYTRGAMNIEDEGMITEDLHVELTNASKK